MTASPPPRSRPGWVAAALLPALNLALALALSAVVIVLVGENPGRALRLLVTGAFGNAEALGYTLYYATTFIFTGLAVAVAFHGGLFNIGAEGQAYIAGLGVALLCLGADRWPALLVIPPPSSWRRPSAPAGPSCRPGCRPDAAATSSSRRSCSTSSPRR